MKKVRPTVMNTKLKCVICTFKVDHWMTNREIFNNMKILYYCPICKRVNEFVQLKGVGE